MKIEAKKLETFTYWFGGIGIITFITTTLLFLLKHELKYSQALDTEVFDHYGSFLSGTVGLLFTIATTILVYLTYQTQKEELKEAREEAEASRKALESQARTNQLQQFENTFFNLLTNHREVLKSLKETWYLESYSYHENQVREKIFENKILIDHIVEFIKNLLKGLDVRTDSEQIDIYQYIVYEDYMPFKKLSQLRSVFELDIQDTKVFYSTAISKMANPEGLGSIYEKVYEPNRSSLGHYFRNPFHLVKFVDEYKGFDTLYSDSKEIEDLKYKYVRLARAQLSNNELILLALNSTTDFGEAFIPLIEKSKYMTKIP